jgi:competence protein ComEC
MFPCYLYLIAHHGSATSSSLDFLKRIIPDYAILSCSDIDGTKFGHPNITTLKTIKQFTSNIFSTQDNGDLIFIIKNNQIIVSNQ